MTADERWQSVQDVFELVRSVAPERRVRELARICSDLEIRAEVESLLTHDALISGTFLSPPSVVRLGAAPGLFALQPASSPASSAGGGAAESLASSGPVSPLAARAANSASAAGAGPRRVDAWAAALIGRRIAHYTIVRLIAAGGMGCVFEAQQERPRRAVALKVMRPGLSVPSALARFRIEPEILARLQHPHIAQVYESGVHDADAGPLPYFAMELIRDARSLTAHAAARGLTLTQRLELFVKLCDAVQHGHQKGVVHRDLKPDNILVGGDGEPKVIDFGVARATDADLLRTTLCTHAGDLIGTLRYMSPEQCEGNSGAIDTRSDVYALGVVLFELLTGALPIETDSMPIYQAIRTIRETQPKRPSALNRALRGDLDAIVLKALEKEPAQRYASAGELGRDVRRHLAREPIDARPPSGWIWLTRWMSRHPLTTTLAACASIVLLSLAGTLLVATWVSFTPHRAELVRATNLSGSVSDPWVRAQLISRSGAVLRVWESSASGLTLARLLEGPRGRAVLISGTWDPTRPQTGSLALFPAPIGYSAPPPLWERTVSTAELPPVLRDTRNFVGEMFGAGIAAVHDFFPNHPQQPAPEVIVCFAHNRASQGCARIYDLSGELLYEFWHDGGIRSIQWMSEAGLLVLAGENQEAFWTPDGQLKSTITRASILMAVRPVFHGILRDRYLPLAPSGGAADAFVPAWSLTLVYRGEPVPWSVDVGPAVAPHRSANTTEVYCRLPELHLSVSWHVDARGAELPWSRFAGDPYHKARAAQAGLPEIAPLPDWRELELRPFLEIFPEAR